MFLDSLSVSVREDGDWELLEPLVYEGRDRLFTVPAWTVTDFASVPNIMTWLVPSTGRYTKAAVLHDYFCEELKKAHTGELPWAPVNSRDADGIFRRIMREEGVSLPLRWLMWTGVRWGSVVQSHRRKGVSQDMPLVLLLSVLALPVILPAVVGVLISLGLYGLVALLTPDSPNRTNP